MENKSKKIFSALEIFAGRRNGILAYHGIADATEDPWTVSKPAFRSQMKWLKEHGYTVLPLGEMVNNLLNKKKMKKSVVITFDDGYVDFLENAIPILKNYNFPATLFVPTGMVGGTSLWDSFDTNKPLLDWDSLREVVRLGYAIGSHGMMHVDVTKLDHAGMLREAEDSKKKLEAELGISVHSFSYPFGRCTERETEAVKRAGYRCAVTINRHENTFKTDVFGLGRYTIGNKISIKEFAHIIRYGK